MKWYLANNKLVVCRGQSVSLFMIRDFERRAQICFSYTITPGHVKMFKSTEGPFESHLRTVSYSEDSHKAFLKIRHKFPCCFRTMINILNVVLGMFFLDSAPLVTAFQGEVVHYSLSLASSKSDAALPKACILPSLVYHFMAIP